MNQYKFTSRSSLSFVVHHNGRQRYVNFSPAYRNQSYYITNDSTLAEKIRQHRWFKEGRIKEEVVEIQPAKPTLVYQPKAPKAPKPYSVLGKTMSAPQQKQKPQTPEHPEAPEHLEPLATPNQPENPAISPDSVTSFMEAKEYFVTNYGIARSECANKAMLEALCQHYNVQFPNYNP